MAPRLVQAAVAALLSLGSHAQIMSVDLGHEFFKVGLMRQGQPLEIVLNTHSKRKTTTAVSFFEKVRTFGDDALAHQGKAPTKVPMFFHSTLGKNYTAEDVKAGGQWWSDFGLGDTFYSHNLGYDDDRGVPVFKISDLDTSEGEELLANIFFFCRKMAEDGADGVAINVKDLVVTIPSDASLRQRQAIVAAGEIAGLRVITLAHEGTAFAVQRAVDYSPEKGEVEYGLFYNLGSRKVEVTIVKFESRQAGMVAGKTAPVVTVIGSASDYSVGGHLMDLKVADVMLKRFQEKHPKLADGVVKNARAMRKILAQAQKTKVTLSANKQAPFIVESLFEDTDFQTSMTRGDFEDLCSDMFAKLTVPIEKALEVSNVTMAEINHVEVVGGAWRVPKVQEILSEYMDKGKGSKVHLGQHLNGEEASALGAALMAANMSSSFRVKKIFLTDITRHSYAVQVVAANGEWEKNYTTLFPEGAVLGSKKKLNLNVEQDFVVRMYEDDVLLSEYDVSGIQEALEGKWKDYNRTGAPKISATVNLEFSGIIGIKTPTATVEDNYWVNTTKPKVKANATNSTDNASDAASTEEGSEAESSADSESKDSESKDSEAKEETEAAKDTETADDNAADNSSSNETVEMEVVTKLKKKKHEIKLTIKRRDFLPLPLSDARIKELKKKLEEVASVEDDIQAMAGVKNELEALIYSSRDKLEREDIIAVSTEEQRAELTTLSNEMEEWMYEDGATKSDYESKLASLQNLLMPMEERAIEMESRSSLEDNVKEAIADMKADKKHIEKNMTWVNENKTEAASTKLAEFQEWWAKKKEQQASLPLHEAPAFTVKEVQEKISKLSKEWEKLKKTKKPKETKPKADKSEKDDGAKEKEEVPLPETVEAAETELTALREKKAAAVEAEDFDTAHSLKQREQALVKHIEKLNSDKTEL